MILLGTGKVAVGIVIGSAAVAEFEGTLGLGTLVAIDGLGWSGFYLMAGFAEITGGAIFIFIELDKSPAGDSIVVPGRND